MADFKSRVKVRVVGYLDGVITTGLFVRILCFYIYPLTQQATTEVDAKTYLAWAFIVAFILIGIITVLAAITLVLSTRRNVDSKRAIEMVRFWMHCNIFTIVVATFGSFTVLLMYLSIQEIWLAVATMIYLVFRSVFTYTIKQELNALCPRLVSTTIQQSAGEDPEIRYNYCRYGRYVNVDSRNSLPESFLAMELRPYRGKGLSVPKCQCLGSRTAV